MIIQMMMMMNKINDLCVMCLWVYFSSIFVYLAQF